MAYEIRVHEVVAGKTYNKVYMTDKYAMTANKWGVKQIRFKQDGKKSATYIMGEKSFQDEYEVDIYEATTGRKVESFR